MSIYPLGVIIAVGLAGACGALARFALVEWVARRWAGRFPLGTFLINVTGAFVLGLLLTAGGAGAPTLATARVVLGTGFLGGYTTFSTLSFESFALARRGARLYAWGNALGTLCAGVVAVALGIAVGHVV